jgi:threonine dehydratase
MAAGSGLDEGEVRPSVDRLSRLPVTPVVAASEHLWLKLENLQPTGSFKVRGFLNAVRGLRDEDLRAGIVTVSAGNAALAAAYVARMAGVGCTVVMFDSAPAAKRDGVRALGAEVLSWSRPQVLAWMAERGWESMPEHFVHPFADPAVIAGHGTLAVELLDQVPGVRRVIVPVGGGGLAAGVATVLHAARPAVEVVGVQSSGYPMWLRTFAEGAPPVLVPDTIADGTTAPYEPVMHDRLRTAIDRWIEVPEADLRTGVAELATRHKVVGEGAGALAYAAAAQLADSEPTVAIISGGNIDGTRLAELLRGGS